MNTPSIHSMITATNAANLNPSATPRQSLPKTASSTLLRAVVVLALGVTMTCGSRAGESTQHESGPDSAKKATRSSVNDRKRGLNSYTATTYSISLGLPLDQGGYTETLGINDHGDLAGDFALEPLESGFVPTAGYIDHAGVLELVEVPGSVVTGAIGINNHGQTVGITIEDESVSRILGFVRDCHGRYSILPVELEGSNPWVQPSTITDEGMIVGTCGSDLTPPRGFVIRDGHVHFYDHPGAVETYLWGGNNRGDVSGIWLGETGDYQSFVLTHKGKVVEVPSPDANGFRVLGRPINDNGQVAGTYRTADGAYTFLFDLETKRSVRIEAPGSDGFAVVGGINNRGVIVGDSGDFTTGVIWSPARR